MECVEFFFFGCCCFVRRDFLFSGFRFRFLSFAGKKRILA